MVVKATLFKLQEQKPIRDKSIILPPLKKRYTDLVKIIPSVGDDEKPLHGNMHFPVDNYAIIGRMLDSDSRSDDERRSDRDTRDESSTDDVTRDDDGPSYVLTGELYTESSEESSIDYEAKTGYSREAPRSLFALLFGSGGTTYEEVLSDVLTDSTIGTMELKGDESQLGHVSVKLSTLKASTGNNQQVNETVQTLESKKSELTNYIISPPLHTSRGLKINAMNITKLGCVSDLLETSLLCSPIPAHTHMASGGFFFGDRGPTSIGPTRETIQSESITSIVESKDETFEIIKSESKNSMVESNTDAKAVQANNGPVRKSLFCATLLPGNVASCGPTNVQDRSERKLDSAMSEEHNVIWHVDNEIFRQAMKKTDIPVTTCERFQQDGIPSSRKASKSAGLVVEIVSEEAFWDPEQKIPVGRRNELSRQKAAVLQTMRQKEAKESNLHKEIVQNVVSDLFFLDVMHVLVLTLGGQYGRMEGEAPSQFNGPQHSTPGPSKLNESEPKTFQRLLEK